MENRGLSSIRIKLSQAVIVLLDRLTSYYSELISHPFQSGLIYFVAGLIPALLLGWILFPMALYSEQHQPLNFSHVTHTDPDILDVLEGTEGQERCLYCHGFRGDGTFVGIPGLEKCMECHDDPELPWGESPEEERFLNTYVANKREVPWLVYSKQPDNVYFTHIAHVKMGEQECETCHGDHAQRDEVPTFKRNRLSGYSINIWGKNIAGFKRNTWDSMKMDDCADCHTKNGKEENNACFVCHK
ncbi:MAG: cytochrome c3 family protein [Deltaproteobacteria bacterium]|nr:cytochrome c3 family protein [Deltaproteobacteria bacterium]MBW2138750.1 cytochrome c3 family protein [Deltaproteobacteria bacterium]